MFLSGEVNVWNRKMFLSVEVSVCNVKIKYNLLQSNF